MRAHLACVTAFAFLTVSLCAPADRAFDECVDADCSELGARGAAAAGRAAAPALVDTAEAAAAAPRCPAASIPPGSLRGDVIRRVEGAALPSVGRRCVDGAAAAAPAAAAEGCVPLSLERVVRALVAAGGDGTGAAARARRGFCCSTRYRKKDKTCLQLQRAHTDTAARREPVGGEAAPPTQPLHSTGCVYLHCFA